MIKQSSILANDRESFMRPTKHLKTRTHEEVCKWVFVAHTHTIIIIASSSMFIKKASILLYVCNCCTSVYPLRDNIWLVSRPEKQGLCIYIHTGELWV
jgi:hypothetical protein